VFGLGVTEILVILVVALIFLGPKRLPEAARSLGRSMAEFRRASNEIRSSLNLDAPDPEPPAARPPAPQPEPEAKPATDPSPTPKPAPND
jgi:TatA/E family protein of Tat protein translocase